MKEIEAHIQALLQKQEENEAFKAIYKAYYPVIERLVRKYGGQSQDAEDLFQEAVLVFFKNTKKNNFKLSSSVKTYIYAISKNLLLKKIRDNKEHRFLSKEDAESLIMEEHTENSYWDTLVRIFNQVTNHCNKLLHDLFFNEKTITEVKEKYNYKTLNSARNQKYKCLEQARKKNIKKDYPAG